MRGTVTTEVFGPDGRLLKKDRQPSRSLVFGFPKLLYTLFTDTSWCHQTSSTKYGLAMAAPPGRSEITHLEGNYPWGRQPEFAGEMWGIQISENSDAITPRDSYIRGRLGSRYGWVRGPATGITSARCRGIGSDRQQTVWYTERSSIVRRYLALDSLGQLSFAGPNGQHAYGLTFDGTYLWSGNRSDNLIHRMDPITGAVNLEWSSPGTVICGLAYDLQNDKIYSMDNTTKRIYRHTPDTGLVEDDFDTAITTTLWDMEWLDGYLYVPVGTTMHVFNPATGLEVHTFPLHGSLAFPVFIGPYWLIAVPDSTATNHFHFAYFPEYGYDTPNLEIGGNEILRPIFTASDGEFTIRRLFTNHTGGDLIIRKVGIQSGSPLELLAVDLLGTPVTVSQGQELRVGYTFQITV